MIRRRSLLLSMASTAVLTWCHTAAAGEFANVHVRRRPGKPPPLVTGDSEDPHFKDAYIDTEEWRDAPGQAATPNTYTTQRQEPTAVKVRHLYVRGGFKNTDTKFTFCFPPAEQYQGRFYQ